MKIHITALHTDLTDAIREYVEKRLMTISRFIKDSEVVCVVELSKTTNHHRQGDIFKADANIVLNGKQIFATAEKADMNQAIDDLRDELERMLTSHNGKKMALFRRGAMRIKDAIKGFQPLKRWKK